MGVIAIWITIFDAVTANIRVDWTVYIICCLNSDDDATGMELVLSSAVAVESDMETEGSEFPEISSLASSQQALSASLPHQGRNIDEDVAVSYFSTL